MSKVKRPRLLEVTWLDSQILQSGWVTANRARKTRSTVLNLSVGFVLTDDDEGVVLAGSLNGANATGVIAIPACSIVKRKRLR